MLDQDGNERIEKEEFKVLETVFSSAARERKTQQLTEEEDTDTLAAGTYINIFQLHNQFFLYFFMYFIPGPLNYCCMKILEIALLDGCFVLQAKSGTAYL